MCYKYAGSYLYSQAQQKCEELRAHLPVPRSQNERDDFFATLKALGRTRTEINKSQALCKPLLLVTYVKMSSLLLTRN